MANKRYYWLKLDRGFFDQKEIKLLRKIAGGDTYTIIYLKLLLASLEDEGRLYFESIGDNLEEELAIQIDEDVENVKITLSYLTSKGLLVETGQDEFFMNRVPEMIGSETSSASRVRRHREKKEALQCNAPTLPGNTGVTKCNDIKRREEKIRERDREELESEGNDDSKDPHQFFQKIFGGLSLNSTISQDISHWMNDLSPEVVIEAMKEAALRNASYAYAQAIMKDWLKRGINTIEKVNEARALFERKKSLQSRSHGQQVREEVVPEFLKTPKQQSEVAPPPGGYVNPFAKNEEVQ